MSDSSDSDEGSREHSSEDYDYLDDIESDISDVDSDDEEGEEDTEEGIGGNITCTKCNMVFNSSHECSIHYTKVHPFFLPRHNKLEGNRIVNWSVASKAITEHSTCRNCDRIGTYILAGEKDNCKVGATLLWKCNVCSYFWEMETQEPRKGCGDTSLRMVEATRQVGLGFAKCERLFNTLEIPVMGRSEYFVISFLSSSFFPSLYAFFCFLTPSFVFPLFFKGSFDRMLKLLDRVAVSVAEKSTQKWLAEEASASTEQPKPDSNGKAGTFMTDTAWNVRGSGKSRNSPGGFSTLIGVQLKKVVAFHLANKVPCYSSFIPFCFLSSLLLFSALLFVNEREDRKDNKEGRRNISEKERLSSLYLFTFLSFSSLYFFLLSFSS